ncbi:uncharacterized protein [Triticum aestivum]|uniref:uncharacterized protein n=1 Tax=Triticum aestivum TaxID=4565 RepID=UPI001D004EEE|nr:uncharacterized protein LOC123142548 [Triticum aestivum]
MDGVDRRVGRCADGGCDGPPHRTKPPGWADAGVWSEQGDNGRRRTTGRPMPGRWLDLTGHLGTRGRRLLNTRSQRNRGDGAQPHTPSNARNRRDSRLNPATHRRLLKRAPPRLSSRSPDSSEKEKLLHVPHVPAASTPPAAYSITSTVMARVSLMLAAAVLACALLATRHAAPAPGGFACNPLKDKTCKLGEPKAPEDTEEEGGLGTKLPSLTSVSIPGAGKVDRDGDGDTDEDDELPSFDTHMTILGH